jgi:DNA-binding transcriptional LysR family regulator
MALLKEIRAFCAVARLGSLTKAAAQLGTTQPSISRQIVTLEAELGVPLIVHGSKPLRLTETGRKVADLSVPYLQTLLDITNQAQGTSSTSQLSVVTLPLHHNLVLPPAVHEFQSEYPLAQVRLHSRNRGEALKMIEEGRCEIGILPDLDLAPQFNFHCLNQFSMVMAASRGHALIKKGTITLEDIAEHPLVLMTKGVWTRDIIDSAFAQRHLQYRVAAEVDTVEMAVRLTALEQAVTFVSPVFDVCAIDPDLQARPLPQLFPALRMGVVTLKGHELSRIAAAFIEVVERVLKKGQRTFEPRSARQR